MRKNWLIPLATFALWLLAVAGGVYWALKFVQGTATPANAAVVTSLPPASVDSQALARGFGGGLGAIATEVASPVAAPAAGIIASRFVLSGVVEGKTARQSLALIAVDGKPARPYRVGAQLAEGVVLASVQRRQALLSPNTGKAGAVTLELAKANTTATATASAIPYTPPVQLPPVVVPNPVQSSAVAAPDPMNPVRPGGRARA
ncbi:MAG: type II secretion system protein N, partial [Burkholderiaceae bacterium]